jgi:integrase
MASWLTDLRPESAGPDAPVFPSATGTPLEHSNVYRRVLRPALCASGIAVNVGTDEAPEWDYRGVGFHAFRKACGSLLFAKGKTLKQVQGWLRHAQLTATMNVYIDQVDDGLGSADVWDDILQSGDALGQHWGNTGATPPQETAANHGTASGTERSH